jgi:two-component system, LytTR family, sensor kinase
MIEWMRLSRPARIALLVFFISTLAGVYFATQLNIAYPPSEWQPWGKALAVNLTHYWIWGALVPLVAFLARRFRFESRGWVALPIHLVASVGITIIQLAVAGLVLNAIDPALVRRPLRFMRVNFHSSLPTYWLILFVYYAFDYSGRAARLRASLTEARLDALKMQLNPHFLFNTLNSISSLMYSDTEAADRMMTRLSELLRSTIQNNGAQEVTLREELEFVDRYLEIEKIRFEGRLRLVVRVDPDALEGMVPAFCLQPLVENALRHGLGPLETGGSLSIEAHRANGDLVIRITDDGLGCVEAPAREGIGLKNTRSRLEELYEGKASLRVGNAGDRGFVVRLEVPFRIPGGSLH